MDLATYLYQQREFSRRTFGPGNRAQGILDHIRKELVEIEANPTDLSEWIDVVILALDGAWRAGNTPEEIEKGLLAKQIKNEGRRYPDWQTADPNKAIEHIRDEVEPPPQPIPQPEMDRRFIRACEQVDPFNRNR